MVGKVGKYLKRTLEPYIHRETLGRYPRLGTVYTVYGKHLYSYGAKQG